MHTFLSCTGNEVELFFRLTPRPSLSDKVHRPQVHLYRIGQLGTLFVCFSLSLSQFLSLIFTIIFLLSFSLTPLSL